MSIATRRTRPARRPTSAATGAGTRNASRRPRALWKYFSPLTIQAAGHIGQVDRTLRGLFGARASKLYTTLTQGHHDLKLPPDDLRRIALWMDSGGSIFSVDRSLDRQATGEVIQPISEPENLTDLDRHCAAGTMYPNVGAWVTEIKDLNGFERSITDAIETLRPGQGFRVLLTDQAVPKGKPAFFYRAEYFPLTGFLALAQRLRVEVSNVMKRIERTTYLTLYQTLQNDSTRPSAALAALEPLYIRFQPARKGRRMVDIAPCGGKPHGLPFPVLVATLREGPAAEGVVCVLEWPFEGGYIRLKEEELVAGVKSDGLRLAPGERVVLPTVHVGFGTGGPPQAEAALRRLVEECGLFEKEASIRSRMILPEGLLHRQLLGQLTDPNVLAGGIVLGNPGEQLLLGRVFGESWTGPAQGDQPAELLRQRLDILGAVKTMQDLLDQDPKDVATSEQRQAGWRILQFADRQGAERAVLVLAGKGGGTTCRPTPRTKSCRSLDTARSRFRPRT